MCVSDGVMEKIGEAVMLYLLGEDDHGDTIRSETHRPDAEIGEAAL